MAKLIKRLGHELSSLFSPSLFFLKVELYKVVSIKCEPCFAEEKNLENNICAEVMLYGIGPAASYSSRSTYTTDSCGICICSSFLSLYI